VDKKKKLKSFSLLQEPQKPSTAMNASIENEIAVNNMEKQILVNSVAFLEAEDKMLTRLTELEMKMELTTITLKATMARIQELEESNAELMEDLTPAERYKIKMEKRRTDHEDAMLRKYGQHPDDMRRAMGWLESEWQVLDEHDMPHVVYYHVESDEQRFDLPDGHILCEDGLIWDTNVDQH
jgi:hypothetical protein